MWFSNLLTYLLSSIKPHHTSSELNSVLVMHQHHHIICGHNDVRSVECIALQQQKNSKQHLNVWSGL